MAMELIDPIIQKFVVLGNKKNRKIKCAYCGDWLNVSIVPHIKREHPEIWASWLQNFVTLFNQGASCKQIMKKYNTLFSWTVIEGEIKKFAERNSESIQFLPKAQIKEWKPKNFKLERTTVWRFTKRGDWAVHTSNYRGNWSPQVPRNLILQYSKRGETVLDPFVGGGTTLIECFLEGRNAIGVDINPIAVRMTKQKIAELKNASKLNPKFKLPKVKIEVRLDDARDLNFIETESIDLICAHPPYANAMEYTFSQNKDLSRIKNIDAFCEEMGKVAHELYRVLRKKRKCAVLIGDVRKKNQFIPLEYYVMQKFTDQGFKLYERIVKEQFNDKSTTFFLDMGRGRHRIAHEFLLIFEK